MSRWSQSCLPPLGQASWGRFQFQHSEHIGVQNTNHILGNPTEHASVVAQLQMPVTVLA